MFEYLMPSLLMRSFPGTLLETTNEGVVIRQIQYGRQRGVPWGISESAYNVRDRHDTYQYRAFGVPGLGFKRGLADDLVIAPYATALALPVAPRAALQNLTRLTAAGADGVFSSRATVSTPGYTDAADTAQPWTYRVTAHNQAGSSAPSPAVMSAAYVAPAPLPVGDVVTFDISTSDPAPFVQVDCYQGGTMVLMGRKGYFESSLDSNWNFGLSSGAWPVAVTLHARRTFGIT